MDHAGCAMHCVDTDVVSRFVYHRAVLDLRLDLANRMVEWFG